MDSIKNVLKIKRNYCFVVFCLLLAVFIQNENLKAQGYEYKYSNFTSENGLSNNSINCIYQDSYGFLWIGTNNGLNKYDGYVFTNYHSNPLDSTSLSNDFITYITEDNSGSLWIATYEGGLNRFDRYNQSFHKFNNKPFDSTSINGNDINAICTDEFGNIWIGTKTKGLYKFEVKTEKFINYNSEISNSYFTFSKDINSILYVGNSRLLIGTKTGLILFDFNKNLTKSYLHSYIDKNSLIDNYIRSLYKDKNNQIWIGTLNSGFQKFNVETGDFYTFEIFNVNSNTAKSKFINCISEDNNDNLLLSYDFGNQIYKFSKTTNKAEIINYYFLNSRVSNGRMINTMFVDKTNTLWLGTKNTGLNKVDLNKAKFKLFTYGEKSKIKETSGKTEAVCVDYNNNLWLGTNDGLVFINRNSNITKIFKNISDNFSGTNKNPVSAILQDKNGFLWIGTIGGGLFKFDIKKEKFVNYRHNFNNRNCIGSDNVSFLFIDNDEMIWIGTTDNGINIFDTKSEKFNSFSIAINASIFLKDNNISVISKDKYDIMWIGTRSEGLINYNKKDGTFNRFRFDASNKYSINSDIILSICENKDGELWIGTNNGLEEFDRNTNSFYHFLNKDGLTFETVNAILADEMNNLWLATNNGITKFNLSQRKFRNYNLFDGLQGKEFNQSCCKSKNGEFFFCGTNGVNSFFPDSIFDKPNNSRIVLTSFKYSNALTTLQKDINSLNEIKLPYSENSILFEFSLLDFTNPSFYSYAFKLDGFDNDWNYSKNLRIAKYTNLDPGNYTFSVKGSNSDEVWTEPINIIVQISYPFWKTWWFYTLLVLGALTIVLILFYKIYFYKRNNKLLELNIFDKSENLENTNLSLQKEILEREKIEESLRYSEEHYRLIVENAIEAIIIFQDGRIVYTNQETSQILDYDFKDMSLISFLNYIHPEDREIIQSNYLSSHIDKNLKNYYSVRIKRKDLKEIIVEINSVILPENEKYEIIFFIKDITSKKLVEDEIKNALEKEKELSELRSRFISMTSHEFRTPLTSIYTSVEILEKFSEQLTNEQKKNNLIRIQENVQQMKRLLNDILTIGKSDAGMYKLNLEPADINKLCSQIIEHFHTYILYNTKLKFKYETENLNNRVLLDGELIKQVIENILSNAIKYSPEGKTIFFKMNFTNRFIILKIKDEGIGIPENELISLFEPFYRASNTGNIPGSGLGLAIVKRFVELHNGKINIKSKIGEGTEFIITIPLIKVT
jgi:PAS domain S-box-containing protein